MTRKFSMASAAIALSFTLASPFASAIEPNEVFQVWPGTPPGQVRAKGEEKLVEGRPRPFYQVTDVSKPMVQVFLPPKGHRSGASVLVLPGGGMQRLAIEHEGYEVAQWLTTHDIAAFVLKYRVPGPSTDGLKDSQRAMSMIKARANEFGIDPDDIGTVGFSAGAEVAMWLATYSKDRQYEAIDTNDTFSSRPAFASIIYPGGLTGFQNAQLKEPILSHVNSDTPSMFIAQAFEDSSDNSLAVALALKKAKVPAELHIFQTGGHGFGVRDSALPLGTWKDQWLTWMNSQGFTDKLSTRTYAREFASAWKGNGPIPRYSSEVHAAKLADAYATQHRVVRALMKEDRMAGFKSVALTRAGQKRLGSEMPLSGVVFRSGQIKASDKPVIELAKSGDLEIAPGLAYTVSVDVSFNVLNDVQAMGCVSTVMPLVELPNNYEKRMGKMTANDVVAANAGAGRYIIGASKNVTTPDKATAHLALKHDGKVVADGMAAGVTTQWSDLRKLINQIVSAGYVLHEGNIIVCSMPELTRRAEPGKYEADFADMGTLSFEVR